MPLWVRARLIGHKLVMLLLLVLFPLPLIAALLLTLLSAEHVVTEAEANVCRDGGDGRNGYDRVHALSSFVGKAAGGGTIPGRTVHGHSAETTSGTRNVACS